MFQKFIWKIQKKHAHNGAQRRTSKRVKPLEWARVPRISRGMLMQRDTALLDKPKGSPAAVCAQRLMTGEMASALAAP